MPRPMPADIPPGSRLGQFLTHGGHLDEDGLVVIHDPVVDGPAVTGVADLRLLDEDHQMAGALEQASRLLGRVYATFTDMVPEDDHGDDAVLMAMFPRVLTDLGYWHRRLLRPKAQFPEPPPKRRLWRRTVDRAVNHAAGSLAERLRTFSWKAGSRLRTDGYPEHEIYSDDIY